MQLEPYRAEQLGRPGADVVDPPDQRPVRARQLGDERGQRGVARRRAAGLGIEREQQRADVGDVLQEERVGGEQARQHQHALALELLRERFHADGHEAAVPRLTKYPPGFE